ncbi:MAG: MATE family efflux transporter, partial [Candidatus Methanomethylophilaceae archaeon]|nr:MATE family efflux transporter [Candidatus Methanomethylophilaceae archaeon]
MSAEGVEVLLGDQRKGIITMCIPIAVALLVQQLNNIVDSLWVSDLGGDSMAALGVVYPLYCVLIGIGNGLGIGVASAIARNIGMKDKANADGIAMQGLVLTITVSVPIGLFLFLTAGITTDLMGAGGMRDECLGYAIPIYISSLFIILSGVVSGMLRGEGAARRSMAIQVVGALVNIVLDPIMIFRLDMGVSGAAWATVISFVVSSFMGLYWYVGGSTYISLHRRDIRPDITRIREILS